MVGKVFRSLHLLFEILCLHNAIGGHATLKKNETERLM